MDDKGVKESRGKVQGPGISHWKEKKHPESRLTFNFL